MSENCVTLHRVFNASVKKVFRAFSETNAYSWWVPPYGYLCDISQMEFRVGGKFKMSFINFTTGSSNSFGGEFLEIKPDEFIKYNDKFDDPNLSGNIVTSVWLKEVSCGTELKILQEGIPGVIPLEMCYLGWQDSLEKLKKLVETEIPEN